MSQYFKYKTPIFLIVFLLCAVTSAFAENTAHIGDVILTRTDSDLLVSFDVRNALMDRVVETLDSGLPIRFRFEVKLVRSAAMLMGGVIADKTFERVLKKDNLKNTYYLTQDDRSLEILELDEAMHIMSMVSDMKLAPLTVIKKGESYRAEVRLKLEEFRLPFHLHRVLPFMNFWDITTPWKIQILPAELPSDP
jgi:hypothetical protein